MTSFSRRIATLVAAGLLATVHAGATASEYVRSWAAAIQESSTDPRRAPPDMTDRTIRQVIRLSAGGQRLRLRLSNEAGDAPLDIGHVEIARVAVDGTIAPGTSRRVTFSGGDERATIPPYAPLVSDLVEMSLPPLSRMAISIHLPKGDARSTVHSHAAATAWIAPGDQAAATTLTGASPFDQRLLIAAVDVEAEPQGRTIVALGDSITDGVRATSDADTRWPDRLAERLQKAGETGVGVANVGISGNRLLIGGAGAGALARFDRDVLAVPGVSHVIVLEGVNDIGGAWREGRVEPGQADRLIDAYRQMIDRAHDRGVKLILATILPFKGAGYWSEWGEAERQKVNTWIRGQKIADGVVDMDAAVRGERDPLMFAPAFDTGDHLHPNDAGFVAMANAIDLDLLR